MTPITRPVYTAPEFLPAALRAKIEAHSRRQWVWVAPNGEAFWVNNESTARNSAKAHGGKVLPPEIAA